MWPPERPDLKVRVVWAFVVLVVAKIITVSVPYLYKWATDALTGGTALPFHLPAILVAPAMLVIAYNVGRIVHGRLQPAARLDVRRRRPACGAPAFRHRLSSTSMR